MQKIPSKKIVFFICLLTVGFAVVLCCNKSLGFAKGIGCFDTYSLNIVDDLQNEVNNELENLNSDQLDDLLSNLSEQQKSIFENVDLSEKIKNIINGTEQFEIGDFFGFVLSSLFQNLTGVVPILASICSIAIAGSILIQMRGSKMNKSLADIIHFACYGVIVVLVFGGVAELVKISTETLSTLKTQMEIVFPILLTLMASLGSTTSVAIYQPLIAILCGVMMQLFLKIVLPIFSLTLIFNVIGNLTSTVKLSKFSSFLSSLFKTIMTFSFTIFASFLTLSGIVASSVDNISIRATKFAIKSYIPIIGGYLSDGFNLVMASSVLIKNAIGYTGIVVLFVTIISPLIKILLFKLGLSLASAIIEPVADKRVTEFVSTTAKSMTMLACIILAFSFAYIICVGLIMCSTNVV